MANNGNIIPDGVLESEVEEIETEEEQEAEAEEGKKATVEIEKWIAPVVWCVKIFLYTIGGFGLLSFSSLFWYNFSFFRLVCGIVLPGVFSFFYFPGLVSVKHTDRWIIEVFGEYYKTYKPGPHWLVPYLMRSNVKRTTKARTYQLWENDKDVKVDFQDDSAEPRRFYIRLVPNLEDTHWWAYRMTYAIDGIKNEVVKLAESIARPYLSSLKLDEGLTTFSIFDNISNCEEAVCKGEGCAESCGLRWDKCDERRREKKKLEVTIRNWGMIIEDIFVGDYILSEVTQENRGNLLKQEYEAKAAAQERIQRAEEMMGTAVDMVSIGMGKSLDKEERYEYSEEDAKELAKEFAIQRASLENDSFHHYKVDLGGLAEIIKAVFGK